MMIHSRILQCALTLLTWLSIGGVSSGQSLSDVILSLSDRQRVVNQQKQVIIYLNDQNNDPEDINGNLPDNYPINWLGAGINPTQLAVEGLDIGGKIAILNQAIGEFERLKFSFLNASPGEFVEHGTVGSLTPYKSGNFEPLARATPGNYNELLRLLAQRVRALRLIQWPASFRQKYMLDQTSVHEVVVFDDPTDDDGDGDRKPRVEIHDHDTVVESVIWKPTSIGPGNRDIYNIDCGPTVTSCLDSNIEFSGYYGLYDSRTPGITASLRTQIVRLVANYPDEAQVSATAPGGEGTQINGTVYILHRSRWNQIVVSGVPSKYEKDEGGYVVDGFGNSGSVPLFEAPPTASISGSWVKSLESNLDIGQSFVAGGYQNLDAYTLSADDPGHSFDYLKSYERNWEIGCAFYSVFKPTFIRGVDATDMRSKLEPADGVLAPNTAGGDLLLHPRPSLLFGIDVGPGLHGAGNGYVSTSPMECAPDAWYGYYTALWDSLNPLMRFDSSYLLQFAGSCSDYHVVYENGRSSRMQSLPGDSMGWYHGSLPAPEFDISRYDTFSLYRAWDSPRLKQVAGRDLVADITYNANHYGGYTVKIYRRPSGSAAPTSGQTMSLSGMTLIRTWTFSHEGGSTAHPTDAEKLEVTGKLEASGSVDEKYEIQANDVLPDQGLGWRASDLYNSHDWWRWTEGMHSWTLKLSQGTIEKLKKEIAITTTTNEDASTVHHITLRESLDGQLVSSLSSMSLNPFNDTFPSDWTITSAGETITGMATLGNDRATRYGILPSSVSINYSGTQPDASCTWDANGLLTSETQAPWTTTGSATGDTYSLTHKLNGTAYATTWTEFLDGGTKVKTYSAPDGSVSSKSHASVSWREVEYGTATIGLPGLPLLAKNSDGTGTTYDWNTNGDGSYVLTLEEGQISGTSVSRGTKLVQNVNTRGFPTKIESFVINGGTVKTRGTNYADPTAWGMPRKASDSNTSLDSSWAYDANLSRISTHSGYLGIASESSGYDVLGRPGTVSSNGISAANIYTAFSTSSSITGGATGSITDSRDAFGRLTSSNTTWNGVTDNLSISHGATAIDINRTTLLGNYQSSVRNNDASLFTASGPTLPFGANNGTNLTVENGLIKTATALTGQSARFQITWTDSWGRIHKTETPSASGSGSDETQFLYSAADSSLQRIRTTDAAGRKTITESDPYNSAGAIIRSGLDADGNGILGSGDRYIESSTAASGSSLITTLSLTENSGLREILKTIWTPSGNVTVTRINGNEETITRTPSYTAKTVTTTSTKGWSKTEAFNNLGLTTNSSLSGAGIPSADLNPTWRADGSLSGVSLSIGGETHSAAFKNDGTIDSLTGPNGNIPVAHSISDGLETLTVDGTTTTRKLDGTQTTTSGSDSPAKTETLATSGSGFTQTITPAIGAATETVLNAAGAPTTKNYAAGAGESYTHTAGGLLESVSLARGGSLAFGYSSDGVKDLTSATWPAVASGPFTISSIVQGYGYDRAGRINEIGDSSGVRTLAYQNGRLASTAWNSGALGGYRIVRSLDTIGRDTGFTLYRGNAVIHSAQKAPNGVSGEVSAISSGSLTATFGRDAARNITSITRGSVSQTWTRTAGRITAAGSSVTGAPSFAYGEFDAKGRRKKCTTTGADWTYTYTNGRLTSATHSTLGSFTYAFDGIGRRTENSANSSDLLNRTLGWTNSQNKTLKVAAHPDARVWVNGTEIPSFTGAYSYPITPPEASGGWVPWNTLAVLEGEGDPGAHPDAKAEQSGAVWVPPVSESFTYDAAGNRESSALWDFGWNAKNELVRARTKDCNNPATPQGYDLTNAFDAEGRRFSKKVNRYQNGGIVEQKVITFLHDGNDLIYERHQLPSGLTLLERKYLWGPDISGTHGGAGGAGGLLLIRETKGNVTIDLYPLYDRTGHVVALTDNTGTLQAEYAYGPFGEPIYARGPKASSCPFRYATKYYDEETGLYNFGRRFLDPITGQWLSREPLGESESINLYSYCGNDPVNYVDVLGLAKIDLKAPVKIIPVPGLANRFQVWFSVVEGNSRGEWEQLGYYPRSSFIGETSKALLETDPQFRQQQQMQAMRSLVDQELLAGDLELLKIKEDTATLLPGGHAAVAISREEYGKAAGWIVGEGVVATVGGELLGRGLSYAGKTGYLMASGSTLAQSRLILGLSKELTTGALTSGSSLAATPLYATAQGALASTTGSLDSGGTATLADYVFPAVKGETWGLNASAYGRVKLSKGTRAEIWERSKAHNGNVYDPSGVKINPGEPWQAGHVPGHKFTDAQQRAAAEGWGQDMWKAYQRDPDIYRPELGRTNMGHIFEDGWYDLPFPVR